jgi:hypothetical protein
MPDASRQRQGFPHRAPFVVVVLVLALDDTRERDFALRTAPRVRKHHLPVLAKSR